MKDDMVDAPKINEVPVTTNVSAKGTTNAADWKSLFMTFVIQAGVTLSALAVTFLTVTVVPMFEKEVSFTAKMILTLLALAINALTMVGKYLQKRLDGPSPEVVAAVKRDEVPEGYVVREGLKKLD